jgi:signal transduction histidine kinase
MPVQNNEIQVQFVISIIVALVLIGSIITFFLAYQKKKLQQEKEMDALKAAFQNELLQTQLEIQEETMKTISMEIHDNIGQIMLLANINVSMLDMMTNAPEAPQIISETKKMLSKASEDISSLARSLHSDRISELGVFEAIKIELTQLSAKNLFKISIDDPESMSGKELPRDTQLLVFRMYQEITRNALKHAEATLMTLSLRSDEKGIYITLADNGKGFVPPSASDAAAGSAGVGMRSLQTRTAMLRGSIHIHSEPGKGTITTIFIPTKPNS